MGATQVQDPSPTPTGDLLDRGVGAKIVVWRVRAEKPYWIEADLGGMVYLEVREQPRGDFSASARPATSPLAGGTREVVRDDLELAAAKAIAILLGCVQVAQLVSALLDRTPWTVDSIRSDLLDPQRVPWAQTSARPIAWRAAVGWVELSVYQRGDGTLGTSAAGWAQRIHAPFEPQRSVDGCKAIAVDLALALIVDTLEHHLGVKPTQVLLGDEVCARRHALPGSDGPEP